MKHKLKSILWVPVALVFIAGCNSASKEEMPRYEQAVADSIQAIGKAKQDSAKAAATTSEAHSHIKKMGATETVENSKQENRTIKKDSIAVGADNAGDIPEGEKLVPDKNGTEAAKPVTRGNIAYYCPKKMLEDASSNVSVIITKDSLEKVKTLLENKIADAETQKTKKEINAGIEVHPIDVYSKMKVELKYSDGDLEILSKPENDFLLFDNTVTEREWDWVIKPKKLGNLQITLIVSAYNESNGEWIAVEAPPCIFNIDVKVDPNSYFVKLWGFLEEHPEWIFMQVLFPVIGFFIGRKKGRKEKR